MKIKSIGALQIFDSRGNPTVEAIVQLESGQCGVGMVPSGASTGHHEAVELRDGDRNRYAGKSVFRAINHIEGEIANALHGWDVLDQRGIDGVMIALDGTPQKSRLGANAILGVSLAVANAAAVARNIPLYASLGPGTLLPLPEIQIFGGGKHAAGRIDIQDFMVVAMSGKTYAETLEMTFNVYHAAGSIMRERGLLAGVADEGGYWPMFDRNEDVFDVLIDAIERAGYRPGLDVAISLDIAATDLYRNGRYELGMEKRGFSPQEFAELMIRWVNEYPISSIEDPMAEDDWEGWALIRAAIGRKCQLIGDDHFTTNLARIEKGVARGTANAVLIKPNQIGTVSETIDAIRRTQSAGWLPVVSARSGETEDTFISHLAVGTSAGQLKVGSFCRSERMAKWNEILRIERSLGRKAQFLGAKIFAKHGITIAGGSP